jgi:hypothetical protein
MTGNDKTMFDREICRYLLYELKMKCIIPGFDCIRFPASQYKETNEKITGFFFQLRSSRRKKYEH